MRRIIIALALFLLTIAPALAADVPESAYDRVMRTGILRCGYNVWPPSIIRDENTGAMSGAYVDYMEAIGRNSGIKIEWTAQLDWGTFPEDLKSRKVDAMCAGIWADGRRGRFVAWSNPVWYNKIFVYVRADDARFTSNAKAHLNAPDVTFADLEGTTNSRLVADNFPQAHILGLGTMSSGADALLTLTTRKADATIAEEGFVQNFIAQHPGAALKRAGTTAVGIYGQSIGVEIHEQALLNFLNAATNEIVLNGQAERIARHYDPQAVSFYMAP